MDVAPGTLLAGRFRVADAPLGQGLTGVVWPAIDEQSGEAVAVKVLHDHLVHDVDAVASLRAVADAAQELDHPAVLVGVGVFVHGGHHLLVTERFAGSSLAQLGDPLTARATASLGWQVADALCAAHDAGLVHGDVRPGNVLVGRRGAALFDFGLAQATGVGAEHASGRPGQTAPEVQRGAPPGVPADLYGVGVVLYRALTGDLPFQGPTPFAAVGAQDAGPPDLDDDVPEGLARLIRQLLDPDPSRRPADMHAVRDALARLRLDPERRVHVASRWLAPFRLRRAWMVVGTDPATGGEALIRANLTWAGARDLVEHLSGEGWSVRVRRETLNGNDVLLAGFIGLLCSFVFPVVGTLVGFFGTLALRSRSVDDRLRAALPVVQASLPPRRLEPGSEYAAAAGMLLLATAALLAWWPLAAIAPALGLVAVLVMSLRAQPVDVAARAATGRLSTLLAEIRAAVEGRGHALDHALALLGEVDALEQEWTSGAVEADAVLARAEQLRRRATAAPLREDPQMGLTLEALRRQVDPAGQ